MTKKKNQKHETSDEKANDGAAERRERGLERGRRPTRGRALPPAALVTILGLATLPASAQAVEEPAVAEAAMTPEALEAALASSDGGPRVEEVLAWARDEGLFDPDRADAAMERARLSALLPQLRVGVRRGLGWDALARQSTSTDSSSLSSGEDLSIVGTLVFQLDRLVFASEETSLLRERRSLEEARTTLSAQIVALYFERRRLLVERALTGIPDVVAELRILEIEALLDALTGGRFGQAVRGEGLET